METLIAYLPALACGAMLLFICIPMMRNMHKDNGDPVDPDARREIAELREEIALLRAQQTLQDDSESVDG